MAGNMQKVILDLFDNVSEPLDMRKPFHEPFSGGPQVNTRDAVSIGERLKPDLVGIGILPRGRIFSTFQRSHMDEALRVIQLLMKQNDRDVQLLLGYLRDNINEELFVYSTTVFVSHNTTLRGVRLPPIEEVLPEKFFPAEIISRARATQRRATESMEPLIIDGDFTGNDLDPEHRLAYWREDIGLNAHHWHWHIVYPYIWLPSLKTVKDRKGELFYYMHQQMIARYDAERLSNNFKRVTTFNNWNDPMPEGYAPHLSKAISGIIYSFRPANMTLQDLPHLTLERLRTWYDRITQSIHRRYITAENNSKVPLDEVKGIDLLGDLIEASFTSINQTFYGDFHNEGHNAISRVHDPDDRYKQEMGVMGDSATAMRDPIFYRWHKLIDNMFQEHKKTLPVYTAEQLTFKNIIVENIKVKGTLSQKPNSLRTFWQDRTINLERGVAFNSPTPIAVRIRHLQHETFTYSIQIENKNSKEVQGTIRIFMAPTYNETKQRYYPDDQRLLMMELDKFEIKIAPGRNVVNRKSDESNVTVPSLRSFGQLISDAESNAKQESQSYCSCGLPDHLLLPRGNLEGMSFQLFAMVTDALQDRVNGKSGQQCQDATSYCGILNEKYPDRRAMGFPFDRPIDAGDWSMFKTPNMVFTDITIRFTNDAVNMDAGSVIFPRD